MSSKDMKVRRNRHFQKRSTTAKQRSSLPDGWADDLKVGLEREIKELDRQIKDVRRAPTAALTLEEKLAGQKQVKALESQRNAKRLPVRCTQTGRALFDAQDEIDRRREQIIVDIEGKLEQQVSQKHLLSIRWKLT